MKLVLLHSLYQFNIFGSCMYYQTSCRHNNITSLMIFVPIVCLVALIIIFHAKDDIGEIVYPYLAPNQISM